MKVLTKRFYILSNNANITISDIRKQLLSWILSLLIIFGLPAVFIGIIEAIELNQTYIAISYLAFYIPIIFAFFLKKRIPFWFTVSLLLFSGFALAVTNLVIYGFSGAGLPIFYTISVLATIFLGLRAGFITLISCSIPLTVTAYLMTNNHLSLGVDLIEISKLPISWITAISIMIFLGSIMIFGYGIIQENLLHTIKLVRKQSDDLKIANNDLEKDIKHRQKIENELIVAKEKAEESKVLIQTQYNKLQSSEEEIRAYNEELLATTDALKDSNQNLKFAKEKAEESDQLKTEFIRNMSHEVRTPLNGILGFSKILTKPNLTSSKTKHYTSIIQSCGNQLMHIIDDILEISELGTNQVKTAENKICLNDLLLELFSIFDIKAKENKIPLYLHKELSNKESTIYSDEAKLNKILSNLLTNALKFTNTGFIEFGYTTVKTRHGVSQLEIYVKDTGIGIKTEKQETIFDRFSQEEKELSKNVGGLGLGLSIAKENAELIGGTITLESEKGKGSTFVITIPYKPVISE